MLATAPPRSDCILAVLKQCIQRPSFPTYTLFSHHASRSIRNPHRARSERGDSSPADPVLPIETVDAIRPGSLSILSPTVVSTASLQLQNLNFANQRRPPWWISETQPGPRWAPMLTVHLPTPTPPCDPIAGSFSSSPATWVSRTGTKSIRP